jgi:hypothetical protein
METEIINLTFSGKQVDMVLKNVRNDKSQEPGNMNLELITCRKIFSQEMKT